MSRISIFILKDPREDTGLPWWLRQLKSLPAMWGIRVQSLGREDPLEKEMVTHSSILALRIMDRGAWQATVHGVTKSQT